jgi:hypothetical protein
MFEYMHTVLNGLKAWVIGEVNKLLSKIDAVGAAASRAFNAATKNKNAIASLNKKLNNVANGVNEAQSTAETAQSTAETAQSTAETAKNEAHNAFVKAQAAERTADAAIAQLNYDNGHFYTRSDLKTPLNLRSIMSMGTFMFYDYTLGGYIIAGAGLANEYLISGVVLQGAVHYIASDWHTNLDDTTFTFHIQQAYNVILQSSTTSSTKQFKITVDDTGTLKATEVTT